jgi:hypothetical protein
MSSNQLQYSLTATIDASTRSAHVSSSDREPPLDPQRPTRFLSSITLTLHGSPCELIGYVMLKLGNTNVARLSGCFCRLFSLIGCGLIVSGKPVRDGTGEPTGEGPGDGVELPATNRLSPSPSLPESAFRVPPTAADTDGGAEGPAGLVVGVREEEGSSESKSLEEPETTFEARSRRRLPSVGLAGGGGGLRMPLVGGLGRRRAGEGEGTAGVEVAGTSLDGDEGVSGAIGWDWLTPTWSVVADEEGRSDLSVCG